MKNTATVSPTESQIAVVAYQFWLDSGCPVGTGQADWFRAEAILKNALVAQGQDESRRPSTPSYDARPESEMSAGFQWEGHWEVWEREWGGARWIWDSGRSKVAVANRAH